MLPTSIRSSAFGVIACASAFAIGAAVALTTSRTPVELGMIAAFASVLLALAWIDVRHRLIPNPILYPAVIGALALSPLWPDRGLIEALIGCAGALAVGLLISDAFRGGLGGGDVKMLGLTGALVGVPAVLFAALITALAGGVVAAALLLSGRTDREESLPYGPFIALGALAALLR
jgi:leader peptidase (prepilin peptidase) / N-methyltransferase